MADGHEEYRYEDFYKAAGENCQADVFLCKETKEMYVPCQRDLPIFDETAKDAKEVQLRFDNRKVLCPINNGSDLNSDARLDALFDDGQYVERQEGKSYKALGFIDGYPMTVDYTLGMASIIITALNPTPSVYISSLIRDRLTGEQIEVEVKCHSAPFLDDDFPCLRVLFYYTPAYVVENFLPKE